MSTFKAATGTVSVVLYLASILEDYYAVWLILLFLFV